MEEGASLKLSSYYMGPYTILRKINDLMYEIQPPGHWNMLRQSLQVSVDRLHLYVPSVGSPDVPPLPHQNLLMHGDPYAEGPIPPPPGDDGGSGFAQAPVPPMPLPPPEWPDETLCGFSMDDAGKR